MNIYKTMVAVLLAVVIVGCSLPAQPVAPPIDGETVVVAPTATPIMVNTVIPATVTLVPPVETQVPTVAPTATLVPPTATPTTPEWAQEYLALVPDFIGHPFTIEADGTNWELVTLAHKASFFDAAGRHTALDPAPFGPQADGKDLGWCRATVDANHPGQPDCMNRVGLWNVQVPGDRTDITADMQVGTRLVITNPGDEAEVTLGWRSYSDDLRNKIDNLPDVTDYLTDYLNGLKTRDNQNPNDRMHLALTFSTARPEDVPVALTFEKQTYQFGYGCYDCAGYNTYDESVVIVPLNITGYVGPKFDAAGSKATAYSIVIPRPSEDDAVVVWVRITVPAHTSIVVLLGQIEMPQK